MEMTDEQVRKACRSAIFSGFVTGIAVTSFLFLLGMQLMPQMEVPVIGRVVFDQNGRLCIEPVESGEYRFTAIRDAP